MAVTVKFPRAGSVYLCLLLISLLPVACSTAPPKTPASSAQSVAVIKSVNDHRDYRYLVLPNQLRVLLISDPHADKAAASMDVNIGSASDPQVYPGLAHFLEHMLFLGTKKYPKAGGYQSFISAHGGSNNAYTGFEHTNYYFDVDPAYLNQTLDRFAQFFTAPLFAERYVEREKHAVHSEYMAGIKDDQRKALDVFKAVINPQHPFSRFSVGSLETLAATGQKPPLRQALLAFYKRYYSANIMTLVVLGKQPLADLERLVRDKFDAIPDKHIAPVTIDQPLFSPRQNKLPLFVQIRPGKKQRTLSLVFPTADVVPFYRRKPLQYIGNILGHEGKGSLFSWLKSRGWAEELSAGTGLSYRGGATFNLSVNLTREGVKHTDDIVAAVFQAIRRIRTTPDQQWFYREQSKLAQQSFRYQEKFDPVHYVIDIASGMHDYSPGDSLRGPYMMTRYDRALIDRFLNELVPGNCLITLSAPGVKVDRQTHFYKARYSVAPVSKSQLRRWTHVTLNKAIRFPGPNPFIADNMRLKSPEFTPAELAIYRSDKPALIAQAAGYKLWYKPDRRFNIPKASILVKVYSAAAGAGARQQALLRMFTELVSDQLDELSYPASLAGLGYDISADKRGFSIEISGFDDKQRLLLGDILAVVKNADFDPRRFEQIRREKIRYLENRIRQQPYRRVTERLSELLHVREPSGDALLRAYRSITPDQLKAFHRRLLSATDLYILVHGNYRQSEALQIGAQLRAVLLHRPQAALAEKVLRIDSGAYVVPVSSKYNDAAMLLYMQGSDLSKKTRVLLGLSAQILRPDFYTKLRTEKQLGYIVTSGVYPVRDVPGIFFLIESPVVGATTLQKDMTDYLTGMAAGIDKLSAADFDRERNALISQITEAPRNLWEQSQKYWRDINQHYFAFDFEAQLVVALRAVTFDEWRAFFKRQVTTPRRAVWIYAPGRFTHDAGVVGRRESDPDALKRILPAYRFP